MFSNTCTKQAGIWCTRHICWVHHIIFGTKHPYRVKFGLNGGLQRNFHFLGFMVNIIKAIKIELYGEDMVGNHFLFNSILKLGKNLVKVF